MTRSRHAGMIAALLLLAGFPTSAHANPLPTRTLFGRQFQHTSHVQLSYAEFVKDHPAAAPVVLLRDGVEFRPEWKGPFVTSHHKNRHYFHACDCSLPCGTRVYQTLTPDAGFPLKVQISVNPAWTPYMDNVALNCTAECGGTGRPCSPPDPGSIPWPRLPDQGADIRQAAPDGPPPLPGDMTVKARASEADSGCTVSSGESPAAGWWMLICAVLLLVRRSSASRAPASPSSSRTSAGAGRG